MAKSGTLQEVLRAPGPSRDYRSTCSQELCTADRRLRISTYMCKHRAKASQKSSGIDLWESCRYQLSVQTCRWAPGIERALQTLDIP